MDFFGIVDIQAQASGNRNPSDVLGISRNTPFDEANKAYRNLAKKYHPDRNPEGGKEFEDKMAEITTAFETVKKFKGSANASSAEDQSTFSVWLDHANEEWGYVVDY